MMNFRTLPAIACIILAGTRQAPAASPVAAPGDDEAAKLFQSIGHYIVEDRKIQNELTDTPLPFLDWGLVQPGFIAYVNKATRQVVPLNDPHDLTDPDQVAAIPVASPDKFNKL